MAVVRICICEATTEGQTSPYSSLVCARWQIFSSMSIVELINVVNFLIWFHDYATSMRIKYQRIHPLTKGQVVFVLSRDEMRRCCAWKYLKGKLLVWEPRTTRVKLGVDGIQAFSPCNRCRASAAAVNWRWHVCRMAVSFPLTRLCWPGQVTWVIELVWTNKACNLLTRRVGSHEVKPETWQSRAILICW